MTQTGGVVVVAVILLFVLFTPAFAVDAGEPMEVGFHVENPVLVANGFDTSLINISVRNYTGFALGGLKAEFILSNMGIGSVAPPSVNTSGGGLAVTTFMAAKNSGITNITARIFYEIGGEEYSKVFPCGQIHAVDPIPSRITFNDTAPNGWLVANKSDRCFEVVQVFNTSPVSGYVYPMPGLSVRYSIVETDMGSFDPVDTTTDTAGTARSQFTTMYKSGNATQKALITYPVDGTEESTTVEYIQKIDHDTPAKIPSGGIILPQDGEATVGNYTPIGVLLRDAHNNPVDNKRELDEGRPAEKVLFGVTGSPGAPDSRAYFMPGEVGNITIEVNGTGWAVTTLRLDTYPGPNIIKIDPLTFVPDLKRIIYGIPDGIPWNITCGVYTDEGYEQDYVLANGIQYFNLNYKVFDEYGNGVQLKKVNITTDLDESFTATTNANGEVNIKYGPKSDVGDVLITATTLQNSSVSISRLLRFVNLTASDMLFTATPQSMGSYDSTGEKATLFGYVVDTEGNPIQNEVITFRITKVWYDENPNWTFGPSLENGTVTNATSVTGITDEAGSAIVYLKPCTFCIDEFADGYDPTATGHCDVVAEWTDPNGSPVIRPLSFTFKNYPYLSVETKVSPNRVNVTGTVDVTLILRGDGFALRPKPIDVMLVLDKSGSMATKDMDGGKKTRMQALIAASKNFVDKMNASTDRIGMLPYSTEPLNTSSPPFCSLGTTFLTVKSRINGLSADGWTGSRKALITAIEHMNGRPNSDPRTIRTILFMTDGEFNYYGDPLARGIGYNSKHKDPNGSYYAWTTPLIDRHFWFGSSLGGNWGTPANQNINTNQNMSVYAKNSHLRIYTISFSRDIDPDGSTWQVMDNLAYSTGGKHFHADSAQELYDVYEQIAGELKTSAGVNTTAVCDFENVMVKNISVPGADAFDYVYLNGISTNVKKWKTGQPVTVDYSFNQTNDWVANHSLDFFAGTIEVNDNWQTTFRLQVLREGDIHVFGPDSIITFDDGTKSLRIPDTIINAIPNLVNESFEYGEFFEEDVEYSILSSSIYEWTWNRFYTGTSNVQEYYFISLDGGYQWTLVGEDILSPDRINQEPRGSFRYDILNLLPHGTDISGATVDFRIKAYAIDAASPRTPRGAQIPRPPTNTTYITLE